MFIKNILTLALTTAIVLSGGVWQNITLLDKSCRLLAQQDFQVLIHRQVPTNDGGIALGQAVVAARLWEEQR